VLIDTRTDQAVARLSLASGSGASQAVAVTPDGRFAYVSIFGYPTTPTGTVWVIDLARRATKTTITTPDSGNEGSNVSPNGRFVFVTDFLTAQVSVIDTHDNQIVANIPVGSEPNETAFTQDGHKVFVTNQSDATVSVIAIP
jgi:YVTN family beta-propeller protein